MNPVVMTLLLLAAAALFTWTMNRRIRPLFHGRMDVRWDRIGERVNALLKFGFGQKRLVAKGERPSGTAHVLVFAAFIVLSIRTVTMIGMGFSRDFHLPLLGPDTVLGMSYLFIKEVVVVGALVGVGIFLYFRLIKPKERLTLSAEGWIILLTIAGLMITELMFEGGELALAHLDQLGVADRDPAEVGQYALSWPVHLFASTLVGKLFVAMGLGDGALHFITHFGFWSHVAIILGFGNFLPYGKHFHIITGLPSVFVKRLDPPGRLSQLDLENSETFGSAKLTDLSWKELLDTYSCTECGRCQTHCPTYVTGKPLSHKELNRSIRHHMEDVGPGFPLPPLAQLLGNKQAGGEAAAEGEGAVATGPELPPLVGEGGVVPAETIWACTTCGWCEQACPVFIENVPRIVDMRRNKVLMEADFPEEAQRVFDGMENQSNPWGVGSNKRSDWTEGLEVPVAADLAAAGAKFEYLFFVGCAGSFDDRQKKVTRSIFKILKEAKIDFAILGAEEGCTGDSARRLGNEYLYQTLAQANIEAFKQYEVTKIITQCPHCFNTIANEYPQFGVKYEVVHHAQIIDHLIREKRIHLTKAYQEEVTFHDSCYLARYNGVTEEPRNVLGKVPLLKVIEMPRNREQGFCCGAGGGRMWLEEKIGSRVNQNRVEEAANTGAKVVASSCPFCLTMLKDGIAETGREEQMQAKDIAEIVAASMESKEQSDEDEDNGRAA